MVNLGAFKDGIVIPISSDISGLKAGLGEAQGELDKTEKSFGGFTSAIEKHGVAIGATMTAAGGAIIALTDSAKEMNADLMTTGLQIGVTAEDMRELALETTNVTFPLEEVTASFDLLARAGMENTDAIQATATAFDTLGDATGYSASEVTKTLIPAFNAFGIPLEEAGANTDTLTHLFRNTTIEMGDFSSAMNYLASDISTLGIDIDTTAAILEAMADKGIQGSAATREFRTAVTSADGDISLLYENLGLTADEVAKYSDEISGSTGMTQDFADAQNTQYGTMDKLKQMFDEFTLSAGSALEPVEGMGAALVAGGPLLMGMSTLPGLLGGVKTAMLGLNLAFLTSPIFIIAVTIAAVVAALWYLESEFGVVTKAVEIISGAIDDFITWLSEAVDWSEVLGIALKVMLGPIGWVQLAMEHFGVSWEDVWGAMLSIARRVSGFITGIFDTIVSTVKTSINWVIDGINTMIRGLNRLNIDVPDWVPGLGGQSFGFNINELPHFATGGIVTEPTLAVVGEAGPEAIVPLSGDNAGMGGVTIQVENMNVRNDNDIKLIARELYTLSTRKNAARGIQ